MKRGAKTSPSPRPSQPSPPRKLLLPKTSPSQMSQSQAGCIYPSVYFLLPLSLSFVIIELITIDWSSESPQHLSPCARAQSAGKGLSGRETEPDPPHKLWNSALNLTPAPALDSDPAASPADPTQLQNLLLFHKMVSFSIEHHCTAQVSNAQAWRLFKPPIP